MENGKSDVLDTIIHKLSEVLHTNSKIQAYALLEEACDKLNVEVPELKSWELTCIQDNSRWMLQLLLTACRL